MSDGPRTAAGQLVDEDRPAVDAATLILLRDGEDGPQVLLLERHVESDFAGGALVFPGGKVDPADRGLPPTQWEGRDPAALRGLLGASTDEDALGLMVAAVRETFEEAGVLLATRQGEPVTDGDLADESFVDARRRLASRDEGFDWRHFLAEEGLVLDLGALAPWSWWVTPRGQHRRFDTRFFVALCPPEQSAAHDEVETSALRWMTAEAALTEQREGRATVIYPTRKNLVGVAEHADARAAWAAAEEGRVDLRRIEPEVVVVDGEVMVQHPDEEGPEPI